MSSYIWKIFLFSLPCLWQWLKVIYPFCFHTISRTEWFNAVISIQISNNIFLATVCSLLIAELKCHYTPVELMTSTKHIEFFTMTPLEFSLSLALGKWEWIHTYFVSTYTIYVRYFTDSYTNTYSRFVKFFSLPIFPTQTEFFMSVLICVTNDLVGNVYFLSKNFLFSLIFNFHLMVQGKVITSSLFRYIVYLLELILAFPCIYWTSFERVLWGKCVKFGVVSSLVDVLISGE